MKVETYRGPFQVISVTSINAIMQKVNDPSYEELNVSLQRLSECNRNLSRATPWMGYTGISSKRQIID